MKKVWLALLVFGLAACGGDSSETDPNNSNNVNHGSDAGNNGNNGNNANNSNNVNNVGDMGGNHDVDMPPDPMRAESGLDARPSNSTCLAVERPPATTDVRLERAFSNLSFTNPVWMQQAPGDDDRWFLIEQPGRVRVFDNQEDVQSAETFIDIRDRVTDGGERGLLGMAFHPDWPNNRTVYLSYTGQDGGLTSFVSAFEANQALDSLDPDSEERLISVDQPYGNHNGGQISFGPDGYLYWSLGDGGSANDPLGAGQDTDILLGSMVRIDISGSPYSIPPDNPFANGGGAAEIFAWGLRNVWRFSFDRETGELYAADVGQNAWEEVSILELGGNYGWNAKEGSNCFAVDPCDEGPWIDPIWEYPHENNNRSITGGYVYRGDDIAGLQGTYLFADFASGRMWGLFYDQDGEPDARQLAETGRSISSFAEANDGELYFLDYGGSVHRILPPESSPTNNFPQRLSETGCVDPDDPTQPAAALIPYEPNAQFWSDGARKLRWAAIPDGETVTIDESGDFEFPNGTVLVKSFELDGQLIETRLMMRHDDGGWAGYTYEWRDDGSDADLLAAGKRKRIGNQEWIYPSRAECMTCHTQAAKRSLGLEVQQLNGDFVYTSTNRISNQLETWQSIGMFSSDLVDEVENLPALVDPYGTDPVEERAAAYLHTNCAQCHRADSTLRVDFDLRAQTPLAERGICDEPPTGDDLGLDDAVLLSPGDPETSLLYLRTNRRDAAGMPALGSAIVDTQGVSLLERWIQAVDCP